jgi:hypothetical protein
MNKSIVISQSMYFPWVGLLEQVKLADVFVYYDDVQFSKGSFTNRVQIKTEAGMRWLTVPLTNRKLSQKIDEISVNERVDWRHQHRELLQQAFRKAPFRDDAFAIVDAVFAQHCENLSDVARASMLALIDYFDLRNNRTFVDSKELGIGNSGSRRVFDIVSLLGGKVYITGHGARNYLDHDLFEKSGIDVCYMQYECAFYPQIHGAFTPYVSGLDLVANCGKDGLSVIRSQTVHRREFFNECK